MICGVGWLQVRINEKCIVHDLCEEVVFILPIFVVGVCGHSVSTINSDFSREIVNSKIFCEI